MDRGASGSSLRPGPSKAVEVHLPATLPPLFPGLSRTVEIRATTVAAVVEELDRAWPGLADRLCLPGPKLRPHLNVYVDGEPAALDTRLPAGARLDVIAAISGG